MSETVITKTHFTVITVLCLLGLLSACTSLKTKNATKLPYTTQAVIHQAEQQGFVPKQYTSTLVTYAAWERLEKENTKDALIHIYIEGDGHSWKSRYQLSNNPTPRNPLSLKLALRDPHKKVIYLARPCQYIFDNKHCQPDLWSTGRYSRNVINSMNEVLEEIKQHHPNAQFLLVGFSGGGNIAAILSAFRNDIKGLITIAGNLDHDALNIYHKVSPLTTSLNAIHFRDVLRKIPQRHYVGERDTIVPAWIIEQYANKLDSDCVTTHIIPNNTHHKGWEQAWPNYIKEMLPSCQYKTHTKNS